MRTAATLAMLMAMAVCVRAEESPAGGDPAAVLREFFAHQDAAARADAARRFGAIAPKAWDDVRGLLHENAPRPDLATGEHALQTPAADSLPSVAYVLRVPPGYDARRRQGWPLVVSTHGTNGSGKAALAFAAGLLGPDADKVLIAAPDSPQPGVYRFERLTAQYPLAVLADVRRRANVDSDRTVLTGYSRGGYTTWGTVLFSPGDWGGAAPMASWPLTGGGSAAAVFYLPNVLNTAVQAHWGENDIVQGQTEGISTLSRDAAAEMKRLAAKRFEGIEYKGQGHDLRIDAARFREFVAEARREAFPADARLIFHALWQGRAWAVRATQAAAPEFDFGAKRVIRVARKEDFDNAKRALWLKDGYEITFRLPPGKNLLAVFARNLKEVQVDLPADRLDWAQPVRVTLNGRTVKEGRLDVDWPLLLETCRETCDFERLVGLRLTLPAGR
jgi:dienelactone hydrolase